MKKFKDKKVHVTATIGVVAIAGLMLFQGVTPKGIQELKIDAISPNQGVVGTEVVISGSGFTTSVQGIDSTKIKDKVYAPGNYVIVKDELINQPLISPDGKTLTVKLDLVSAAAKRECDQKFSKNPPQPCKVPVKVINAHGKPSNDVQFTFIGHENNKPTYTITVTQAPNGTITPDTTSVTSGGSQTFTITPAIGYQIANVIVDGVDQGGSSATEQTYTFNGVTSAHSITAKFSHIIYTITVTQTPNGTITPGTTLVRSWDDSPTFTIAPAMGYQITNVFMDGVSVATHPSQQWSKFEDVIASHTLTATFSPVPLIQPCSLTVSVASTTPVAQTITPGQTGVTLVKFNATSNCDGTLNSFAVSLLPTPNGYQNISTLRLYDDVTGVQLGTTQNVTTAGINFPSVHVPLTANQALVLRVVGDVSPSAVIGSTVYGVFGGSYASPSTGGLIGNNASGNLISGNTMTVR